MERTKAYWKALIAKHKLEVMQKLKPKSEADKIDFEQQRITGERYESRPRRRNDKRLFDALTPRQQDAYNLIEEARNYEMSGLPAARMKYSDAPGGYDLELTPSQLNRLLDYRDWLKIVEYTPAGRYAVFAYMEGVTLRDIERALSIGNGKAGFHISSALNEYCIMKKWGNQVADKNTAVKMRGLHTPVKDMKADYRENGLRVRDFRNEAVDTPGHETVV